MDGKKPMNHSFIQTSKVVLAVQYVTKADVSVHKYR